MSKILLIVIFVTLCSLHAWPQAIPHVRVKGRVTDKDSQQPLADATVALLYAKDSSRAASGFTDKNGAFVLEGATPGAYQLLITYIGYQQQLKPVSIPADTLMQLGNILLQRTGVTLGMVEIVKVRAPMVVKKDTLEFNADYYKVRENAVMEELLKKLPGVEIDPDGTVKVNGEAVKRILVDGKPFFGDDPKLAIRNLPADMIDKVQLVDRKSDQGQFTGGEDGKREKAINITIKKEKKGSFLGSVAAGYGTDDRFAANVTVNRFGDGEQLSFLGGANNVNNSGFLQGSGVGIGAGGNGITRNWNGGVNYNKDLNKQLKIGGSYMINNNRTENERNSARQNLLPDTTYYYNQNAITINDQMSHIANIRVEYRPDTMHFLMLSGNFSHIKGNDLQKNLYESQNGGHQLVNKGQLYNSNVSDIPTADISFFFGKKFKKQGRSLAGSFYIMKNISSQEGYNHSDNQFVQPDGTLTQDTINQRNDVNNLQHLFHLTLTYSEPVFKDRFLEFFYAHTGDYTTAHKLTYDYNTIKSAYDKLNDSLSNAFKSVMIFNMGSIGLHTKKQKYDYIIGWNMVWSALSNENINKDTRIKNATAHFFPMAVLNYAFTNNKRLRFSYAGSPQQPALNQLQPVPDNSNPLYVQEGNPDLKVMVNHNFSAGYNSMNPSTLQSFSINMFTNILKNKIVNMNWFDSLGKQVSQPVNVNGAYNLGANIVNVFPLKKLETAINSHTNMFINKDINYTNGVKGNILNLNVTQRLGFHYVYKSLFDVDLSGSVGYNRVKYSVQENNNASYFNYIVASNATLNLPFNFTLGGNLNYLLNIGRASGYNLDFVLLNAFISKSLFANRQGILRLQAFDLLDRNVSISRNVGENYIEDVNTQVLRRFFMLSFSWLLRSSAMNK